MIFSTIRHFITGLSLVVSSGVWAHGQFAVEQALVGKASLIAGYSHIDNYDNVLWQVPGVLMGGEAFGAEPGFILREASLHFTLGSEGGSFATAELSSHGHSGESGVELEQALVGWFSNVDRQAIKLQAGLITPLFSKAYGQHASVAYFTRKPLIYELIFGGHGSETGVNAQWQVAVSEHSNVYSGMEIWKGEKLPAKSGDSPNAIDAFTYWRWHKNESFSTLGAWYYAGKAKQRGDTRLDSGHSHDVPEETSASPDIRFTGDTRVFGIYADWNWQFEADKFLELSSEYTLTDISGTLQDETRQSSLDGKHTGLWAQAALGINQHKVAIRYDHVVLDNSLNGTGASLLADSAKLINDHEPNVLSLAYEFQIDSHLRLRLENRVDKVLPDTFSELMINLIWSRPFTF